MERHLQGLHLRAQDHQCEGRDCKPLFLLSRGVQAADGLLQGCRFQVAAQAEVHSRRFKLNPVENSQYLATLTVQVNLLDRI